MRKLKLQVQVSIDGFMSGENGELNWLCPVWPQSLKDFVTELCVSSDCILLGKNLAQGFIPHWTNSFNSAQPEEGAEFFVTTPKIVFSKSLSSSEWENTSIATGDLVTEVNKIKNKSGKDILVYGGVSFVSALLKEKLIDELHLFINPSAIGKGLSPFKELNTIHNFKLMHAQAHDGGVCVLSYQQI